MYILISSRLPSVKISRFLNYNLTLSDRENTAIVHCNAIDENLCVTFVSEEFRGFSHEILSISHS